jgi:hypothetical protein
MTRQEIFEAVCEKKGHDASMVLDDIKTDFGYADDEDMEDFGEFCDAEDLSITNDEGSVEDWLTAQGYLS